MATKGQQAVLNLMNQFPQFFQKGGKKGFEQAQKIIKSGRNPDVYKLIEAMKAAERRGNKAPKAIWNAVNKKADRTTRAKLVKAALKRADVQAFFAKEPEAKKWLMKVEKLRNRDFWTQVGDVVATVANQPIFQAVVTAATAAIPGVGLALAPLAAAGMSAANAAYRNATGFEAKVPLPALQGLAAGAIKGGGIGGSGSFDLKASLSGAIGKGPADMGSQVVSQVINQMKAAGATPAVIQKTLKAQATLAELGKQAAAGDPKARKTAAVIRGIANPQAFAALKVARTLVIKSQGGDPAARAQIARLAASAQKGNPAALRGFATVTAISRGLQLGQVPKATPQEKKIYGWNPPDIETEGTMPDDMLEDELETEELEDDSEVFEEEGYGEEVDPFDPYASAEYA